MARRNPNAPSRTIWLIALIVGLLGILSHFVVIEAISPYSFWLVTIGFALLAIGTSARGV